MPDYAKGNSIPIGGVAGLVAELNYTNDRLLAQVEWNIHKERLMAQTVRTVTALAVMVLLLTVAVVALALAVL